MEATTGRTGGWRAEQRSLPATVPTPGLAGHSNGPVALSWAARRGRPHARPFSFVSPHISCQKLAVASASPILLIPTMDALMIKDPVLASAHQTSPPISHSTPSGPALQFHHSLPSESDTPRFLATVSPASCPLQLVDTSVHPKLHKVAQPMVHHQVEQDPHKSKEYSKRWQPWSLESGCSSLKQRKGSF